MKEQAKDELVTVKKELVKAKLLVEVCQELGSCKDINEALEALLNILVEHTNADRGSIFLNDEQTGELYSRFMNGNYHREIRILNSQGLAGHVFTTGEPVIVHDAYQDARFDRSIDEKSGYQTRCILTVPIRSNLGMVMGVAQLLNKKGGSFLEEDKQLVEEVTDLASFSLANRQQIEKMSQNRKQEMDFLDVVSDITSEIKLGSLLKKVMKEATRLLKADRGTLFLNDEKTNELFIETGEGLKTQIRFPNHLGIAGTVFSTGKSMNIPYAYADLRFNPSFDKTTGYFTRSILCVPVVTKEGKRIGVTQMLNKKGGAFNIEDESRQWLDTLPPTTVRFLGNLLYVCRGCISSLRSLVS